MDIGKWFATPVDGNPDLKACLEGSEHRMGLLRSLQAELYDSVGVPVLDAMRKFIKEVEASDNHLFKSALASMPID